MQLMLLVIMCVCDSRQTSFSPFTEDELKGGTKKIRRSQLELFLKFVRQLEQEGGDPSILFGDGHKQVLVKEKKFIPLVEPDDTYL